MIVHLRNFLLQQLGVIQYICISLILLYIYLQYCQLQLALDSAYNSIIVEHHLLHDNSKNHPVTVRVLLRLMHRRTTEQWPGLPGHSLCTSETTPEGIAVWLHFHKPYLSILYQHMITNYLKGFYAKSLRYSAVKRDAMRQSCQWYYCKCILVNFVARWTVEVHMAPVQ